MERTIKKEGFYVLTNDPSITAWGWAVIDSQSNVIKVGCIKTGSENKVRRIRKGDDTIRRISEINQILFRLIKQYNVVLILSELPHGSQSASAAVMMGVVAGIMQTFSDSLQIPIEWYSEGDAKKAVLGKLNGEKKEMIAAIDLLYDVPWPGSKYANEAVADSMAIYHVANTQSNVLTFMKNRKL